MASIGQPLMPWQRLVADVGLELLPNGLPAYREIVCTVPRQSGKTTLMLGWELHRALMWGSIQRIAYTAQTLTDGYNKLIVDQYEGLLKRTPMDAVIKQVRRALATAGMVFENGSRIEVLASSEESGHGKTLDLGVIDEAFADDDFRREQGLRPTMATRPDAQILVFSTAGTEKSVFLKHKVETGRKAVDEGLTSGVAYFEWSAPDGIDLYDPDNWGLWMPALGHTITPGVVEADSVGMSDGDFRRAYGNLWTVSDDRVIPMEVWEKVCVRVAPEPVVFGLDAAPGARSGSIAVADEKSGAVIECREGVGWMLERVLELASRHNALIAVDEFSPVGHLIEPLEARGVRLKKYGSRGYAYACASFFDRVNAGEVQIDTRRELDLAVAGAHTKPLGDAWKWLRRDNDTDISPLVALTLALDAANSPQAEPDPGLVVYSI